MSVGIIQRRLAAAFHRRHIQSLAYQKGAAEAVGRVVDELKRDIIGLCQQFTGNELLSRVADATRNVGERMVGVFQQRASAIARWSYSSSRDAIIDNVPPTYFKKLIPSLPIAESIDGENLTEKIADEPPIPGGFGSGFSITTPPVVKPITPAAAKHIVASMVFSPLTPTEVKTIVQLPDRSGQTWQTRLTNLSRKVTNPAAVAKSIADGVAAGENLKQITKRVDTLIGPLHGSALRVARTETGRIAEVANRQSWLKMGDLLAGAQIVAVLDQRTRPEHAARHGTTFYADGRKPSLDEMPVLPDAPNCRCLTVPVLPEPNQIKNDPQIQTLFGDARGQVVPEPASYDRWFDRVGVPARQEAVGKSRYNEVAKILGDTRPPEWSDFIMPDGRLLAVKQIKRETEQEKAERKRAVDAAIRQREADFKHVFLYGTVPQERDRQPGNQRPAA